jgi:tripartite-type tricarboxylate transporter receptor subunit TctC
MFRIEARRLLLMMFSAVMVPDLTIALPQLGKGLLRAYGVTSATRAPTAPDTPTLAESGLPEFEADQWFGLAAPAGTPRPIIDKIYAAVKNISRSTA